MRIEFLKDGQFALHPARGPIVPCKKGAVINLPDKQASILIEHEWARQASLVAPEPAIPDMPPWEQESWDSDSEDAKNVLIAWATEHDLTVDKRRGVSAIIEELEDQLPD